MGHESHPTRLFILGDPERLAGETAHARQYPVLAAADEDRLAAHQSLGDLGAAALEHAAHGLARNAHGLGGLLVAEGLKVYEANGLEFVDGQLKLFELSGRYAGRLEERDARDAFDGALESEGAPRVPLRVLSICSYYTHA